MSYRVSRRAVVAGALALAACNRRAESAPALPTTPVGSLKDDALFPIGVCAQAVHFADPNWVKPAVQHFSQITPEWEMKMEYIVQEDGQLRFDAPDQIAEFCAKNGMGLFGHALVWYSQKPMAFERIYEQGAFERAYDDYIDKVVGRYKGKAVAWDVVNEPIAEMGDGYRESLWATRLGEIDYMRRAYDRAHAADPGATLFLNEYNLEFIPKKLDTFQRLVEQLLKAGAPLQGIGTQTHTAASLAPGKLREAVKAIGRFGLPVHISELDVSLYRGDSQRLGSPQEILNHQGRVYAEAAEAMADLPARQRFGITLWGLRDKDSWLLGENAADTPMLFDNSGALKPVAPAFAEALKKIPR